MGELRNLHVPPQNVKRIYTEFEPCNFGGNNCVSFLRQNSPNTKIYYSYPFNNGMNDISRVRKYQDLGKYSVDFD